MKKKSKHFDLRQLRVIAVSLGTRYSGINASMVDLLPEQAKHISIAVLGFNVPDGVRQITFREFFRYCHRGQWRVWHARRNVDMLAGLILRYIFRFKLILVFTSAAQRHHSWLTRFYYHHMSGVICPTEAAASFLDRPSVVVSHGVNTEKFSPPRDRSSAWAKRGLGGRYGIGTFGRVRFRKGTEDFVDAMIRALPRRPEWTAVIIGETTKEFLLFKNQLQDKIRGAGLEDRIRFTGFIERQEDIAGWYRSLSVVVCPSRVEGFGLPALEAMASGCPVVATRTGVWPQLISGGQDGYLVPCADTNALTVAIEKITEDPQRVNLMGQRALEKVTMQYRVQIESDGIIAVYKELFAKRGVSL
jgi:glycosyltransferase involved in cell wall biosynthesis